MSGGHLLCADRSGTKTHCGDVENVAEATRRRRRIQQSRILSCYLTTAKENVQNFERFCRPAGRCIPNRFAVESFLWKI